MWLDMEYCFAKEIPLKWRLSAWEQWWLEDAHPAWERLEAPADLGRWVCPSEVLAWAADEVELLPWNGPGAAGQLLGVAREWANRMLTLLSFAYARQMFDSEGIAHACRTDPMLQRLCPGSVPFANEFRTFRRRYRRVLERVLAGIFMRGIRHRFDLRGVPLPVELEQDLEKLAAQRLDIARHMDTVECA